MRAGKFQVVRWGHSRPWPQTLPTDPMPRLRQLSNPEKIKKMSKRQLRMIRKTQVDKNGKVQLVSPWS